MINSMTAYASSEKTDPAFTVSVEIRSYNSRYLDITLRIPQEYPGLEDKIKGLISGRLSRGRIEVRLSIKDNNAGDMVYEIDLLRADALDGALTRLKERYDWNVRLPVEFLTGHGGVLKPVQKAVDMDRCWPLTASCLTAALEDLMAMRRTEGDHIADDLTARLRAIEALLADIRKGSERLGPEIHRRLLDRIAALTNGVIDIDPARVAQEAAFLADKSDISEEIVRAESHLKQFAAIMASDEPAGRKFNFLLQECNREFNTMGAKVSLADMAHRIVAVKSELEKIREQVQNIE